MPFTFKPAYQLIMRDDRNPFFIFTFSFPWRWRESSTIDGISCAEKYITLYQAWARSCRWREISWNNQLLFNHHSSHHSSLSFFTTFFSFASYRDYISERGMFKKENWESAGILEEKESDISLDSFDEIRETRFPTFIPFMQTAECHPYYTPRLCILESSFDRGGVVFY